MPTLVLTSWSRYGGYEDSLFAQHVLRTVEQHDPQDPYFLFWAPHIVHTPLEVPPSFYAKFAFMEGTDKPTHERQTCEWGPTYI